MGPKSSVKAGAASLDGAVNSLAVGESIELPGNKGKIKRIAGGYQVVKGDGTFNKVFKNASDAINMANDIVSGRKGKAVKK